MKRLVTFFVAVTVLMLPCVRLVAEPPVTEAPTQDSPAASSKLDSHTSTRQATPASSIPHPKSIDEARARAKLLHEMIRGSLQIMHRDFFDEDGSGAIPSASMEDVFHELGRSYSVQVKWLVVNTDVVNVDHKPSDEFERSAARALASGQDAYETASPPESERYRYAGPIRLRSQCLKCHVKRRTSNEDRVAGLVISMPLAAPQP